MTSLTYSKAGLILDIEGGMLDPRFIRILIDQIDIRPEIGRPMLFSDIFDEDKEQAPCCFRIVGGAPPTPKRLVNGPNPCRLKSG